LQLNIISEKTWEKKEHLCVVKFVLFKIWKMFSSIAPNS
jgi:hypothetical protein